MSFVADRRSDWKIDPVHLILVYEREELVL
jgi:hypothetical protein